MIIFIQFVIGALVGFLGYYLLKRVRSKSSTPPEIFFIVMMVIIVLALGLGLVGAAAEIGV